MNDIWQFELRRGNSDDPRNGACLLDAVSWFEYGTLGDHPACVCPAIASYARQLNDVLPDDRRQELKRFLPRLVGTVDPIAVHARVTYQKRRTIREIMPIYLRAAKKEYLARLCEELSPAATMVECEKADHEVIAAGSYAYGRVAYASADPAVYAVAEAAANDKAIDILDGMLAIGKRADPPEDGAWAIASERFRVAALA